MRCRGSHRSPDLIRRTRAMLLSCGDALVDFLPVKSVDGRDATVPVVGGSCLKVELRRRCRSSSRAVRTSPMRPRPSAPPVSPPGPWQQFRQIVHLDLPRHDLLEHIGEVGLGSSSRTSDRPCRTEGEPARRERQGARTVLPVVLPTTSCGLSTAEHRVRGPSFYMSD
jgi:hypothetical protein